MLPCGGCTYPGINFQNPLGLRVGPRLGLVVIWTSFQSKFPFCRVLCMSGIELCGVRIELAVGSHPITARNPSNSYETMALGEVKYNTIQYTIKENECGTLTK